MRFAVVGFYGKQNVGDECYREAIPSLFPEHSFSFDDGMQLSDFTGPQPEAVLLGGGDVVRWPLTGEIVRSRGHLPLVAASVTLTKDSDFDFLRRCRRVLVRDFRSLELARDRGIAAEYAPDFAFALEPDPRRGKRFLRLRFAVEERELRERLVCVVVNAYLMATGLDALARDQTAFLAFTQGLAEVENDLDASLLFLPFGTGRGADDRASNAFAAARCKWQAKILTAFDRFSPGRTLDAVAACDAVVSTRLHATIFATIAGVPFVDVTHHDKNRGFLETLGHTPGCWSTPYWGFDKARLRELLEEHLGGAGDGRHPVLASHTAQAKERLRRVSLL